MQFILGHLLRQFLHFSSSLEWSVYRYSLLYQSLTVAWDAFEIGSPMQIKWIEDPDAALDKEIDSLTLVFNHTGFSQTSFREWRMQEKQARSVAFLKSHILSEEVTNCPFHTIRSVKRPDRGRLRVLGSRKGRWAPQRLAGKQCSEGTLNLKHANQLQVVFALMLFIFLTDLLVVKLLKQRCRNVSPQKFRKFV